MSDKESIQNNIDDKENPKKEAAKKPLSDEVKQRIAGLLVIGVITVGLCAMGIVGRFSGDSIPTASVSSSVSESSAAENSSSVADGESSSSGNSVDENSQEDESSDTTTTDDESTAAAGESSQQETSDSQSGDTPADSEQPKTEESSQADKPQTAKPSKTEPAKTDPPKTDPPKTDPPKTDPPKTDPPAPSGGLSVSCSVNNSWMDGNNYCMGIDITINNGTSSEINGWTVSMTVPSGTEISGAGWCGIFSVNGNTITITNESYNGVIPAGGHVTGIGMNIKSPSEFTPTASVS